MPVGNTAGCVGECAQHIAQYMLDEFWDDTMSSKPVSAASAGSELLPIVVNGGVESGSAPWYSVGDSSPAVAQSNAQVHGGMHSLMVFDRNAATDGAGIALNGLEADTTYRISVWVRLNSGEDTVALRLIVLDDTPSAEAVAQLAATDTEWTLLTGLYTHNPSGEAEVAIYVDGPASGAIYYLDDLTVEAN